MNHSKKILFIILTIILISLIICLPNIKNMYNVNKEKEKYLKLIQENKILLNEINKLTKRVNEIEENYNFVANAKEYKNELVVELKSKQEESKKIKYDIELLNKKITIQSNKNNEIKKHVIE